MADKYDDAVAYLTKRPDMIPGLWLVPTVDPNGIIFGYLCDGDCELQCGCPTQVRAGTCNAQTPELTALVRDDTRIPKDYRDIRVEHLSAFAEVQRLADKMLGRK